MTIEIIEGDCRVVLKELASQSAHCIVTSPPYFGLRDYGVDDQMGLEPTPDEFVEALVGVLREARRVLRDDGTLWLNLGDSYSTHAAGKVDNPMAKSTLAGIRTQEVANASSRAQGAYRKDVSLPEKNLMGIPWRVAFALQADGWYLRQDIIWHKPNPMPESVRDRCTKAHEYIFLLSKSPRYYYDSDAVAEPVTASTIARISQANLANQKGSDRVPGKTNGTMKAVVKKQDQTGNRQYTGFNDRYFDQETAPPTRNRRSVWTVTTKPFKEAHFATFPPDLIEPCVLAGCPPDGTVLDPFFGAGTTGLVAQRTGRSCIGIELNPAYYDIAVRRLWPDETQQAAE